MSALNPDCLGLHFGSDFMQVNNLGRLFNLFVPQFHLGKMQENNSSLLPRTGAKNQTGNLCRAHRMVPGTQQVLNK